MGVKITAVGIGDGVNSAELSGVATDQKHVFSVGNFDLLKSFQEEIKALSCGGILISLSKESHSSLHNGLTTSFCYCLITKNIRVYSYNYSKCTVYLSSQ